MIKAILLALATSATILTQQAEFKANISDVVESQEAQAYVLCVGECNEPTPKTEKIVLRRHTLTPEQRAAETKERINGFIKRQSTDTGKPESEIAKQAFEKLDSFINTMAAKEASVTQGATAAQATTPATPIVAIAPTKLAKQDVKPITPKATVAPAQAKPIHEAYKNHGTQANEIVEDDDEFTRTIYFDLNSSEIKTAEKEKLDKWLPTVKINDFDVTGYTCQLGGENTNAMLASKRADAVKKYILSKKKDAQVEAVGLGKGHYVSPENLDLNRRVEVRAFVPSKPIPVPAKAATSPAPVVKGRSK